MRKILVIDNHDSFVYNLVELLRANENCTFDVVLSDDIDLDLAEKYDMFLLSPGAGLPFQRPLMMKLIERYASSRSILGVCLGFQALAEAFGGELVQLPYPKHGHTSTLNILDGRDILYKGLPNNFNVGRYHSWVVNPQILPKDFYISSEDEDGNIMSMAHKTLPLYGVQFHPESIISQHGQQIINNWIAG
ncbi:MAG: aminodeoxychorismate/anthranilate synthase component II [Bacteroidetes bacterium]|nr:aminodeoxychorismate/anthranilate synthase component II [Bacteroidota bacterium]